MQNTFWKEEANEKGAQNERVVCVWGLLHMQTLFGLRFETTALRVDQVGSLKIIFSSNP